MKNILIDLDGVLTNGKMYITHDGEKLFKAFYSRDVRAIRELIYHGYEVYIVSADDHLSGKHFASKVGAEIQQVTKDQERDWYNAGCMAERIIWRDKVEQLEKQLAKAQEFKTYVHKRLDEMGIEQDPESPHKEKGCRIGGRLDIIEQRLTTERERLKKYLMDFIEERKALCKNINDNSPDEWKSF